MPTNKNPPETLTVFGTVCRIDRNCVQNNWSNYIWQSNQKDLFSLSIAVIQQIREDVNVHSQKTLTPGWTVRIEWWNGYNNRIFVASRRCETLEEAKQNAIGQMSKLVEGSKKIHTRVMLGMLQDEKVPGF